MLDFIADPFNTLMTWLGYGIVFFAIVTALFFLVAIPLMFKLAAVAFARVLVVETSKVIGNSVITSQIANAVSNVNRASLDLSHKLKKEMEK